MPEIEEILEMAREAKASDVHLIVGASPRMRINGKLCEMGYEKLIAADTLDMLLTIMTEEQRERFEEKGECIVTISFPYGGRCRINAYKQNGNVAFAIRLIDDELLSLEELGILEELKDLCEQKSGLILLTGVSGSGRSTTLSAIIEYINDTREAHIITLEKPIEYLHSHKKSIVNQREIEVDVDTYSSAIKAAIYEDADIIVIGEMEDCETIQQAIFAAETGHLVFAVMNISESANVMDSIIKEFLPYQQQRIKERLAEVLKAILFQQLLPLSDNSGCIADFKILHINQMLQNAICNNEYKQVIDKINMQ